MLGGGGAALWTVELFTECQTMVTSICGTFPKWLAVLFMRCWCWCWCLFCKCLWVWALDCGNIWVSQHVVLAWPPAGHGDLAFLPQLSETFSLSGDVSVLPAKIPQTEVSCPDPGPHTYKYIALKYWQPWRSFLVLYRGVEQCTLLLIDG